MNGVLIWNVGFSLKINNRTLVWNGFPKQKSTARRSHGDSAVPKACDANDATEKSVMIMHVTDNDFYEKFLSTETIGSK